MNDKKLFFLLLLVFLKPNLYELHAQLNLASKNHYIWFDEIVGNGNLAIYNGTIFEEKFKAPENNHRFLLDDTYHLGNLIYDNQPYYNIYLKYDIHEDQVIAKLAYKTNFLFIKLIKEKITSFEIDNSNTAIFNTQLSFISSETKPKVSEKKFTGFYQVLHQFDEILLLKKNFKKRGEIILNNFVYSNFLDKGYFVILRNNNYFEVNSKYDFINIFPNQKKYISIFYRRNRKLLRTDKDQFYTNLMKDLQVSISKT